MGVGDDVQMRAICIWLRFLGIGVLGYIILISCAFCRCRVSWVWLEGDGIPVIRGDVGFGSRAE